MTGGNRPLRAPAARSAAYGGLNGAYWMLYCVAVSYAGVFLLARGYTNSQVGLIIALGYVLGLAVQAVAAPLADRQGRAPVAVMLAEGLFALAGVLALALLPGRGPALTAAMTVVIALAVALQPMVNAFSFYLERFGSPVPFGLCRSVGSAAYALLSAGLGVLTVRAGANVVPVAALWVLALFLGLGLLFFLAGTPPVPAARPEPASGQAPGSAALIRGCPGFPALLAGTALIFFGHAFVLNFTIQIVNGVGGDSGDMGALAAYIAVLELPGMWLFDRLRRRFTCTGMIKFSALFFMTKNLLMPLAGSMAGLYGAAFFQALSFPLYIPASVRYVGEHMPPGHINKAQSLLTGMITVGNICISALGGVMLDQLGLTPSLVIAAASTAGGALVICLGMKKEQKPQTANT